MEAVVSRMLRNLREVRVSAVLSRDMKKGFAGESTRMDAYR